jgi:hypothetical protein
MPRPTSSKFDETVTYLSNRGFEWQGRLPGGHVHVFGHADGHQIDVDANGRIKYHPKSAAHVKEFAKAWNHHLKSGQDIGMLGHLAGIPGGHAGRGAS